MTTVCERFHEAAELLFDNPIVGHGFTEFARDYDVLTDVMAAKPDGTGSYIEGRYRVRFTHCPYAATETQLDPETWRISWQDSFIDWDAWRAAGEPSGFVWAQIADAYPGASCLEDSDLAGVWSRRLKHSVHELKLETNAYTLRVVFHDFAVRQIGRGDPRSGTVTPV